MTLSRCSPMSILCASAVLGTACAHAPAANEARRDAVREERVYLTGSRIPRRVDPRTGQPEPTTSPVQVYFRDQLLGTGQQGDLGRALRTLDPGVSVAP